VTARDQPIGDDDLQAFIDGRVAPERRAAIEAYLATHPAAAEAVTADSQIGAMLRARLAARSEEPIPSRLRIANILAERRSRVRRRLAAVAAAVAWLVIGGGAGWFANTALHGGSAARPGAAAETTRDAIAAYRTFVVEKLHPVEVRADQEAHLVQWLSRRLGKPLTAPDLTAEGYELMGGRLLPTDAGPAAMFMYADKAGDRLTLYARVDGSDTGTGFRFEREEGVAAFAWVDRDLSYVVAAAKTDRPHLLAVAEAIYDQLSPAAERHL
jgi:anti-sigma factor RsiW